MSSTRRRYSQQKLLAKTAGNANWRFGQTHLFETDRVNLQEGISNIV